MSTEKRVAKITSTFLGIEDHGIFTYGLDLDYGGGGQRAGNICLGGEWTEHHIKGVLDACGVDSWEKLVGRTVFAYAAHSQVFALEPLPTEPGKRFVIVKGWNEWSS